MSKPRDREPHSKWVEFFMAKIPYSPKLMEYSSSDFIYPDLPSGFRTSLPSPNSSAKTPEERACGWE